MADSAGARDADEDGATQPAAAAAAADSGGAAADSGGTGTGELTGASLGENSPGKRKERSEIFTSKTVVRLRGNDPRALDLLLSGFTHVCMYKEQGCEPCRMPIKLGKNKSGTWITTRAFDHHDDRHPNSKFTKARKASDDAAHAGLVDQHQKMP